MRVRAALLIIIIFSISSPNASSGADHWHPTTAPMMTQWSASVTPDFALPEYPRPQLVRTDWQCLNGLWDYAIRPKEDQSVDDYDGKILVPFPVESALSGVMKRVGDRNRLWYRRTFDVPKAWLGKRTLLHFGAIDWQATIFVNGKRLFVHEGGYTHFTVDITDALKTDGPQELVVADWDPTETGDQPRGKQLSSPRSIWYSPVTGIWQTVWLEPVTDCSIDSINIVPNIDTSSVQIKPTIRGTLEGVTVDASIDGEGISATSKAGEPLTLLIPHPQLWSPDSPHLYNVTLKVSANGATVDEVTTYFGMRKIALARDAAGAERLFLNNKPLFQFGPLDQGWWPDGLYTAPSDAALRSDLELDKSLGFNMTRKHVKVEPDRWYYWCDKLGLLVWQDMPSGFRDPKTTSPFARSLDSAKEFETELKEMIDELQAHPCIALWVVFNESWGQYDTRRITQWTKTYDPTRLVDNASGWNDANVGDVHDLHKYPDPDSYNPERDRAVVLGEFGGLNLLTPGHLWREKDSFGYRKLDSKQQLTDSIVAMVRRLHDLSGSTDLSAAVYTQLSDVEIEINGLITYDRSVVKVDVDRIAGEVKRLLSEPPPIVRPLLTVARDRSTIWQFTTTAPPATWNQTSFDPVGWRFGACGFGVLPSKEIPIRTLWNTDDIWLRTEFTIADHRTLQNPYLRLTHIGDAEIYLNGKLIRKVSGRGTRYEDTPITDHDLFDQINVIAIHCHQFKDGQQIDAGVFDLVPAE